MSGKGTNIILRLVHWPVYLTSDIQMEKFLHQRNLLRCSLYFSVISVSVTTVNQAEPPIPPIYQSNIFISHKPYTTLQRRHTYAMYTTDTKVWCSLENRLHIVWIPSRPILDIICMGVNWEKNINGSFWKIYAFYFLLRLTLVCGRKLLKI